MPPRKAAAAKPVVIEEEQDIEEILAEEPTETVEETIDPEDKLFEELGIDLGEPEWEDEIADDPEDAGDIIAKKRDVMVQMRHGYSYSSPDYEFTRDDPFQLMSSIDAERLIKDDPEKWAYATKETVADFYASKGK